MFDERPALGTVQKNISAPVCIFGRSECNPPRHVGGDAARVVSEVQRSAQRRNVAVDAGSGLGRVMGTSRLSRMTTNGGLRHLISPSLDACFIQLGKVKRGQCLVAEDPTLEPHVKVVGGLVTAAGPNVLHAALSFGADSDGLSRSALAEMLKPFLCCSPCRIVALRGWHLGVLAEAAFLMLSLFVAKTCQPSTRRCWGQLPETKVAATVELQPMRLVLRLQFASRLNDAKCRHPGTP